MSVVKEVPKNLKMAKYLAICKVMEELLHFNLYRQEEGYAQAVVRRLSNYAAISYGLDDVQASDIYVRIMICLELTLPE